MTKKTPNIPKRSAIVLIFLMVPLAGIGIDLFVPSLPAISHELHASETLVKLTIAYYLVGFAVGQPIFGTISDSFGRKKPLLLGMILYILISYSMSFARTIHTLLMLRFTQGLLVAAPATITRAIRTDIFLGRRVTKLSSAITMTWAMGTIVSPVIGGYLEQFFGWQSNFYFFALYGLAVLVLAICTFQETNIAPLQFKPRDVMRTYKSILSHRGFIGFVICISIVYSIAVIFNTLGPFLIQKVLGYSAMTYGHFALVLGVGYFLGSLGNGFLLHHYPISVVFPATVLYGCIVAAGMLLCAFLYGVNLITLIVFTFLLLLAAGSIFPNSISYCLHQFPKSAGTAGAIMGTSFVSGSAGIAFITSTLETTSLVPISLLYLILMILCLFVYLVVVRQKLKAGHPGDMF